MPLSTQPLNSLLRAAIGRLDRGSPPIAEVNRRIGVIAVELGLRRPSYEQVRVAVHAHRRLGSFPGVGEVLLDVASRSRPPEALQELLRPRRDRRPKPK